MIGTKTQAGTSYSTVYADMDFETYSEAGLKYFPEGGAKGYGAWYRPDGAKKGSKGLPLVGADNYSRHESTEVLCLAYDLKDGLGPRLWAPGLPDPQDLFEYIESGGLVAAWNSAFEYYIWLNVCQARLGWPALPFWQLRDDMAKSAAFAAPMALKGAAQKFAPHELKDGFTHAVLTNPRNGTKNDRRSRNHPHDDPANAAKLYEYCLQDIKAEAATSAAIPDLDPDELNLWLLDQHINFQGTEVDYEAVKACVAIFKNEYDIGCADIQRLTHGIIETPNELAKVGHFVTSLGVEVSKNWKGNYELDEEHITAILARDDLPEAARQVLDIRKRLAKSSVKKLFSLYYQTADDNRIRGMFQYHGAATGRWSGRGPQPQNFPNSGPKVIRCDKINGCGRHYGRDNDVCPWCSTPSIYGDVVKWNHRAMEDCLEVIGHKYADLLRTVFGEPVSFISACLRGLLIAKEGHEFICSDYSAIEAVVAAAISGEQWRLDVFASGKDIYCMSAAKISGVSYEEMMEYKERTGEDHPLRKELGKIAELASGYQGGIGAYKNFGADKFMTDPEIEAAKTTWRKESPNIVNFWKAAERAARDAITYPGQTFEHRGHYFGVKDDVLYIRLLSGRKIAFHSPRIDAATWPDGSAKKDGKITYMARQTAGAPWKRKDTFGGDLFQSIVQGTARDLLAFAMMNVQKAGYNVVMHIHDEIVSEVLKGFGSIEEFEAIMATLPTWAAGWPVTSSGGYRGLRFRK